MPVQKDISRLCNTCFVSSLSCFSGVLRHPYSVPRTLIRGSARSSGWTGRQVRHLSAQRKWPRPYKVGGNNTRRMVPSSSVATEVKPTAEKFRKDYKAPSYLLDNVELGFDLDEEGLATTVRSRLEVKRNEKGVTNLVLDAEDLKLVEGSLKIDGKVLEKGDYLFDEDNCRLTITNVPARDRFILESQVEIKPGENKSLEGLYMSGGNYCTQCEAEGFRKICPFFDRPDVMAKYTTTITAPKDKFPVLLSNGNCVESRDLDNGRHFAKYVDPWRKPSYLFALVAGDLVYLEDRFTTMSGKVVTLRIYVREGDLDRAPHAMESLKKAMKWDEENYGREYDLDIFNIVAVSDFNMGAMENKSLNIFNSKYVLANEATATDGDFNAIEGVVGHEYFHNWTGNRVTCRDWFQLSLKEGLTVFRDQSFSQEMSSVAVKRIRDVFIIRAGQFAEDSGPMAHPVRPDSYITCNNFYTLTVYRKGSEVIRMLRTLLGPKGFRAGTDLYFSRHDGCAVTCDDWVQALQDANPQIDLTQFRLWYSQAGTPSVVVKPREEPGNKLILDISQSIPDTPGQTNKKPMHIPLSIGLVGPDGSPVPVDLGDESPATDTKVLSIREASQSVILRGVPPGTVPSLLRDFSAPVKLSVVPALTSEKLAFLMANDTNDFARWEAGQTLMLNTILGLYSSAKEVFDPVGDYLISAIRTSIQRFASADRLLTVASLTLPAESFILEQIQEADPVRIRAARLHVKRALATGLYSEMAKLYEECAPDPKAESRDKISQGKRALRNVALHYLATSGEGDWKGVALRQMREAANMTEELGALGTLCELDCPERRVGLEEFYAKWKEDELVIDNWLRLQATTSTKNVLADVERLSKHEIFDLNNPNKCYSLLAAYAGMNMHMDETGAGYTFITDKVLAIDPTNPQVAARIVRAFSRMKNFTKERQILMRKELERIQKADVSKDVYEIVTKTLDS